MFGPGIDEPVVLYQGATLLAANQHYYRADAQGSIIATTDNSGVLRDTFKYGPYGEPSNPGGQPIQFTGRRWDPETGLYYYRARYLSPILGRFLQTDSVGYKAGNNLYSYVANDPVNNTDPTGEVKLELGAEGTFVAVVGGSAEIKLSFDTENLEVGFEANVSTRAGLEAGIGITLDADSSSQSPAANTISQETAITARASFGPIGAETDFANSNSGAATGNVDVSAEADVSSSNKGSELSFGASVGIEERVTATTSVVADTVNAASSAVQNVVEQAENLLKDKILDRNKF